MISKREARVVAARLAYEAVQKALIAGGEEEADDLDSQIRIDNALDDIAQKLYERAARLKGQSE